MTIASGFMVGLMLVSVPRSSIVVAADGDAWTDTNNPVRARWDGQRLDWWSLRPLRQQEPSQPIRSGAESAVDAWIDTILEKKGLSASSRATRETLIRRVTWDMTGLPPSVEEIEAFVKDPNPDAYERLVDRLLADPNYGVQWGQHWLDVVRYSESNGFERDEFRPTIWRFRNYVIDAFNQDLPFDQFVGEQLAGDELNQLDPSHPRRGERLAATGYLRLGPWDKFKQFFDSADAARDELMVDLTNTTGTAFLGQSLSCCRCHDHMTDPLLQSDHYRFRAYFAAIEFDNEVILDDLKGNHEFNALRTDRPIGALLSDLKQRGLLETTLVVWCGEFGRTPMVDNGGGRTRKDAGRNHNNLAFSIWMAGGGVKGGQVLGATDDFGLFATEMPSTVHDLHATLLRAFGLDADELYFEHAGRQERLIGVQGGGSVIKGVFA